MGTLTHLARSILFVPGSNPRLIAKAAASAADVVCLDLDDSVTLEQKPTARATIIHALQHIDFGRRTRMVRINALDATNIRMAQTVVWRQQTIEAQERGTTA